MSREGTTRCYYPNAVSTTDVDKWERCKSKVLPVVRIFRGWRASEREGRGSKKVSFTRERTAVGSNPLGNEKTNGSGPVRNRVRSATFLAFILSLHDTGTRRPLDRCLLGRHRDVYIARTAGIERSAGFERRPQLFEKGKDLFFSTSAIPSFTRS